MQSVQKVPKMQQQQLSSTRTTAGASRGLPRQRMMVRTSCAPPNKDSVHQRIVNERERMEAARKAKLSAVWEALRRVRESELEYVREVLADKKKAFAEIAKHMGSAGNTATQQEGDRKDAATKDATAPDV